MEPFSNFMDGKNNCQRSLEAKGLSRVGPALLWMIMVYVLMVSFNYLTFWCLRRPCFSHIINIILPYGRQFWTPNHKLLFHIFSDTKLTVCGEEVEWNPIVLFPANLILIFFCRRKVWQLIDPSFLSGVSLNGFSWTRLSPPQLLQKKLAQISASECCFLSTLNTEKLGEPTFRLKESHHT